MMERRRMNRMAPYRRILQYLGDHPTEEELRQYHLQGAILGYQIEGGVIRVRVFQSIRGADWLEKRPGEDWRFVSERYGYGQE
jgi:hypothetical protein